MKRFLYLLFPLLVVSIVACATSSDLRAVHSDLNRQMEEKLVAVDSRIAELKKEQDKNQSALVTMRKGQANSTADFAEMREQIQQIRGQLEILKKEVSRDNKRDTKKEDEYKERVDNLILRINFIENFLEISKKDSSNEANEGITITKDSSAGKQDKATAYAAAYQMFKAGQYSKAQEAFQTFLAAHPTGEYSDSAQFWIGECNFFEKKYEKAILEYDKVTKKFPSSSKVPYALLKQGISFQKLGDKTSARLLLQQVIKDYPNTSQARIARSKMQELK